MSKFLHPKKTTIMGILNITPDSFFDGGKFFPYSLRFAGQVQSLENSKQIQVADAIEIAKQMVADGADILDVGGESSRPGAEPVSIEEELRRVLPIIAGLKREISVPISIDTYKPEVVEQALAAGASIVNDITGLTDPAMVAVVAKHNVPVIIMHMQGKPQTMQENPVYVDVVNEICTFFRERIAAAKTSGIKEIILDPGIGFGKTLEHNLTILKRLSEFTNLGYPILVGPSRKSFIGKITGLPVEERLEGTLGAVVVAVMNGAAIVRVHDVKEARRVLDIVDAIRSTS